MQMGRLTLEVIGIEEIYYQQTITISIIKN